MSATQTVIEAGYAVAIGLVIGFEREHNALTEKMTPADVPADKVSYAGPDSWVLGSRTFSLLCLGGWLTALLGDLHPAIVPVGIATLIALSTAGYVLAARRGGQLGLTTEVAAAVTVLIGALVRSDRALAVTLGLATVLLLVSKPWMQAALGKLRRLELIATVQLLVAVAIVLPLLPAAPLDPWQAIPPRKVGVFIVLIAGVEYVGYVLHRLFGARRGALLAGLVGGLTSSTAVTAAMARQARRAPASLAAGQLATFLANAVMGVRVAVVAAVLSPEVALRLAAEMGAFVAVLLGGALWWWRRSEAARRDQPGAGTAAARRGGPEDVPRQEDELALRNPFALVPALTWGAILCGVLLVTELAQRALGDSGILLASLAAGLADVDAITLAASRQAVEGALAVETAALAILLAVASNTLVKSVIAFAAGGRAFGRGVATVFALGLVLAGAVAAAFSLL